MTTLTQYSNEIHISGLSRSERDALLAKIADLMNEMGIDFQQKYSIQTATVVTLGDYNYEINL
jgi:hypothetical protein